MEWVGEAHNACVRHVIGKLRIDPKMTVEQVLPEIEELVSEYFGAAGNIAPKDTSIRSSPDSKVVSELLATLGRQLPLSGMLAAIEQLEATAVSELSGNDLLFFQGMSAIARHSAMLWAPAGEGGEALGNAVMKPNKYVEVALADARGYKEGGLVHAVVESIHEILRTS